MTWLHYLAVAVTPADSVAGDLTSYILNFGVLGVVAIALAFRLLIPAKALDKERDLARADLIEENRRLLARAEKAEEQLAEAQKLATETTIPLIGQFTAATASLLPILQELIRDRDRDRETGHATERRTRR